MSFTAFLTTIPESFLNFTTVVYSRFIPFIQSLTNMLPAPEQPVQEEDSWEPLRLFNVKYPSGDLFGMFLAFSSYLPVLFVTALIGIILMRRCLYTFLLLCGIVCNEILNTIFKRIIDQGRPSYHVDGPSTSGMPSAHAQFVGFTMAFVIYSAMNRFRPQSILGKWYKFLFVAKIVGEGTICCYSRVYLMYHTVPQVLVGLVIGGLIGVGYTWFINCNYSKQFLTTALDTWLNRNVLFFRDYSLVEDSIVFEFQNISKLGDKRED